MDLEKFGGDMSVVTNARHYDILRKILSGVEEVEDSINQNITKDFIAIDVRSIISLMSEITDEITNDEILGTIFLRFCIGK